jgi:lipopolysaccharide assembly outer membrane protein LptD (OstA)
LIAVLGSASIVMGGHAVAAEASAPASSPSSPAAPSSEGAAAGQPSGLIEATPAQQPPIEIELSADHQGFDLLANRFVATGNVKVNLAGGRLLADRLEYESATRTIYASGRVRFQRGNQYLQASKLRYSLIENSGEIDEVYGVLDLDSAALDLNPSQPPSAPLLPLSYWTTPLAPFNGDVRF